MCDSDGVEYDVYDSDEFEYDVCGVDHLNIICYDVGAFE